MALEFSVNYLECGMYLIAACMPSLRVLFIELHQLLSNSVTSLLQRRRMYPSDNNGSAVVRQDAEKGLDKIPADRVFVKLTDIGNLSTLARDCHDIGVDEGDSALHDAEKEVRRSLDLEAAGASAPSGAGEAPPICHVCKCAQAPTRR